MWGTGAGGADHAALLWRRRADTTDDQLPQPAFAPIPSVIKATTATWKSVVAGIEHGIARQLLVKNSGGGKAAGGSKAGKATAKKNTRG